MMSWVSLSPVMKITGTCASVLLRLRRLQISKPSMLGITASMRMTSGVILATIASACLPSSATRTVMPASSSASVSMRSVSGESSTTSTMSPPSLGRMTAPLRLEDGKKPAEIERMDDLAQVGDDGGMLGRVFLDVVESGADAANMADFTEPEERIEVVRRQGIVGCRRRRDRRGAPRRGRCKGARCKGRWRAGCRFGCAERRCGWRLGVVPGGPFDVEQSTKFLHQLAQVER